MSALRAGEYLPPAEDSYDPAMDMKAHSSKHRKAPVEQESYLSKEQLQELRKVQHERIEVRGIGPRWYSANCCCTCRLGR